MKDFNKNDVQKVAKYTHWSKENIGAFLADYIYPNRKNWIDFSKILTLVLGAGLFGIGVIFFFAYNWDVIPKFTKLSIIFGLILVFTILSVLPKLSTLIKQLSLTLAATMVGVLFAVFGQIYQTGANAYDFFLAWTIFSFIWVLVARFIPLWILYIALLNVTLYFYFDQIKPDLRDVSIINYFYTLNFIALIVNCGVWFYKKQMPNKIITYLLALTCVIFSIIFIGFSIFNSTFLFIDALFLLIHLAGLAFVILLGLKYKQAFYIAIVGLAIIVIFSMLIIKIFDNDLVFFPLMLLIIASTTGLVFIITNLLKKWKNE